MNGPIICFIDIETDGPLAGSNSMLSLGCVAYRETGTEVSAFARNLCLLEGAMPDPAVAKWWQTQPEAWAAVRRDPASPANAMAEFVDWARALGVQRLYAAYPLIFDAPWIDWYLRKFTDWTLCDPFRPNPLFEGTGIDIPTYVQTVMKLPNNSRRNDYPPEVLTATRRPHWPIEDARAHAELYFNARKIANERRA